MPRASRSAAASGLLFRQNYSSFRLIRIAQIQCHAVSRVGSKKMMNSFSKKAALELLANQIGSQNVRNALQKIASVRLPFDAYTNFAQAFDPTPHSRTLARSWCTRQREAEHW